MPGLFIRASLPMLNTSCSGAIASVATDAHAARMKSHAISLPPFPSVSPR